MIGIRYNELEVNLLDGVYQALIYDLLPSICTGPREAASPALAASRNGVGWAKHLDNVNGKRMSQVWLVRAGSGGELSEQFRDCGCISIAYRLTDDLTDSAKWPDIRAALYKNNKSATRPVMDQIWQFLWTIEAGDLIVTPTSPGFSQTMVGVVSGERPWFDHQAANNGGHSHRRKVDWATEHVELKDSVIDRYRLRSVRRTVYRIEENVLDFWMQLSGSDLSTRVGLTDPSA